MKSNKAAPAAVLVILGLVSTIAWMTVRWHRPGERVRAPGPSQGGHETGALTPSSDPPDRSNLNTQLLSADLQLPIDGPNSSELLKHSPYVAEFKQMIRENKLHLSEAEEQKALIPYIRLRERQVVLETALAQVSRPQYGECILTIPPHDGMTRELLLMYADELLAAMPPMSANMIANATTISLWQDIELKDPNAQEITLQTSGSDVPSDAVRIRTTLTSSSDGKLISSASFLMPRATIGSSEYAYLTPYIPH